MIALGWRPYQNDHEDANGQFEMNWEYDSALKTADRHAFFKYMVKSIAEKHGLRATFMPKPFPNLTGNGCHVHISLWSAKPARISSKMRKGELGLSPLAYNFLGGIMHTAEALAAITNPTVNSYKRLNAPPTLSGATWSPNTITYAGNNRTHMIRVPDRWSIRAPAGGRGHQSVSVTGRAARSRARRRQEQARSRKATRHRYVHRRPHGRPTCGGCRLISSTRCGHSIKATVLEGRARR